MPDVRRPLVLLLANAVRDDWTRALEAAGLDVNATGWLDGVTAARLRRPDVVLVSTDLPQNAPQTVCNALRMSVDLASLPVIVAGPGAERLDAAVASPNRADHYLPAPVDVEALAGKLLAAVHGGRIRWVRKPVERVVIGLVTVAVVAILVRMVLGLRATGKQITAAVEWVLFAAMVVPFVAAIAVGLAARMRPLSIVERRAMLGWSGVMLWNVGRMVPGGGMQAQFAGLTLGCCAHAAWAWLGPQAKPRSSAVARAFRVLAGALVLLGVAPWALLLW